MSAVRELLDRLAEIGATVQSAGNRLVLRAGKAPVPAGLVSRLRLARAEVMAALAEASPLGPVSGNPTAWHDFYEERAAIREYSGHYPRDLAERLAFGEVVEAWCRQHVPPYNRAICTGCGQPLAADVLDLSDGSRVHWERHREFACLIAAGIRRKKTAIAALAKLSLQPPPSWSA